MKPSAGSTSGSRNSQRAIGRRKKPDESDQELAEELADVLFVILCMANEQGIDLDQAFDGVMEKYRTRDGKRWARKVE